MFQTDSFYHEYENALALKKEPNRVIIFDTTLRDGEQSPGLALKPTKKLMIAHQLAKLGVDVIEAGFPASSYGDFLAVQEIANNVKGPVICALARLNKEDINAALLATSSAKGHRRVHLFIPTSNLHLHVKFPDKTKADIVQQVREMITYASSYCRDVQFGAEDATRSDRDFLCTILETAINAGAKTLTIADTVGCSIPKEYGNLIKYIIDKVPGINNVILATHCHNDLGMAIPNSLAGIENGARQVECTQIGLGERGGNTALEPVAVMLKVQKNHYPYYTKINTEEIYQTSQLISSLMGVRIPDNQPVVGKNAFAHESGIHQAAVLKNPLTYEYYSPQLVGWQGDQIVLGRHSGKAGLLYKLEECNLSISKIKFDQFFLKFKQLADQKKLLTDSDFQNFAQKELAADAHTHYKVTTSMLERVCRITPALLTSLSHCIKTLVLR